MKVCDKIGIFVNNKKKMALTSVGPVCKKSLSMFIQVAKQVLTRLLITFRSSC